MADATTKWDGIPPNPEQRGWHWLRYKGGGDLTPWQWTDEDSCPGDFVWATDDDGDPEDMARQFHYVGPCVLPEFLAQQTTALRSARELIAEIREQDFESYTVGGDPASMDEAEAGWIGEYDAVLGLIDGALNG